MVLGSQSNREARRGRNSKDQKSNIIQTDTGKTTDTQPTTSATPTTYNGQDSGKANGNVTQECKPPGKEDFMDHNVRDGEGLKEQGHVVHPDQVICWSDERWVSYHGIC